MFITVRTVELLSTSANRGPILRLTHPQVIRETINPFHSMPPLM